MESANDITQKAGSYAVKELLKKAARNYSRRVDELTRDMDSAMKELIGDELTKHGQIVSRFSSDVESRNIDAAFWKDSKGIVDLTLTCFISDMEKARKQITEKLGGASPHLEGADKEVSVAQSLLKGAG